MIETILLSTNVVEKILQNNWNRVDNQIKCLDEEISHCTRELQRLMEEKVIYTTQRTELRIALDKCQKR